MKVVCRPKLAANAGASPTREEVDTAHLQKFTESILDDLSVHDAGLRLVQSHPSDDFSPEGRTTDEQVAALVTHEKFYEGFCDALRSGENTVTLPMRHVLDAQSAKWTNLLKMPKCVDVTTNVESVMRDNLFTCLFDSTIGFAQIPWRTGTYDLTFMQRVLALYYLVPASHHTSRVELEIPEHWLRALTLKGKRITPYKQSLNIKDHPNLQFLSCVTGFGKTLTAALIGLSDICLPSTWARAQAEYTARIFERRRVPQSNFFEGGDVGEQKLARAILIVAPQHLLSQWEEAVVDMAHGMLAHLGEESGVRICVLRNQFDLSVMQTAPSNYAFVVLAAPTVELSDRLREHPDIHFVSRFDDELVTPPYEEPKGSKGHTQNTTLFRRFRVMESLAAMRHMLINATFDSLQQVCRQRYHPVREQLTPGGTSIDLPTHERLAAAVCKASSATVELHLDQFARLYLMSLPPSITTACKEDALAQMCENFLIEKIRCKTGTLEGRLTKNGEVDMASLPLPQVLVRLFRSCIKMSERVVMENIETTIANHVADATNLSATSLAELVDEVHDEIVKLPIPVEERLQEARALTLSALMRLKVHFENMSTPSEEDAECGICCESMLPPREVVVMRCCTHLVCAECAAAYNPCPFCRATDPTHTVDLNAIMHRRSSEEAPPVDAPVDSYDTRIAQLRARTHSFFRATIGVIDALMLDNTSPRILIGMHNRNAASMSAMVAKIEHSYPTACVEAMEHFKDKEVAEVAELRRKYNDCSADPRPYLWIIDSDLSSASVAGMDLPATHAIIMSTSMTPAAQWQLAGRAVRRTPRHLLPEGEARPRDKRLVLLSF